MHTPDTFVLLTYIDQHVNEGQNSVHAPLLPGIVSKELALLSMK